MGLLGTLAKAIGGAALEGAIGAACGALEQIVKALGVGRNFNWSYDFVFKGKVIATINVTIRKSRENVTFTVAGLTFKIPLSGISKGCIVAVNAALALL